MLFLFRSKATRHEKAGKTNLTRHRGIGGAPTNCRRRWRFDHKNAVAAAPRTCRRRRRGAAHYPGVCI